MSKMCMVKYLLNEEGRKKSLLDGGNGKRLQILGAVVSKELLDIGTVDNDGECTVKIGFRNDGKEGYCSSEVEVSSEIVEPGYKEPYIRPVTQIFEFSDVQTVEDLLKFETERVQNYEKSYNEKVKELEPLLIKYNEDRENKREEQRQREIERQKKLDEEYKKSQEASKKREAEKQEDIDWINNNGSDYLKQCIKYGYNCKRKYMIERIEKEFPQFELDFDDNADWKERVSPSQEALDEVISWIEKGFDAEIVWLTSSVHGGVYDYERDFEPREAIRIVFKGYYLIKEM